MTAIDLDAIPAIRIVDVEIPPEPGPLGSGIDRDGIAWQRIDGGFGAPSYPGELWPERWCRAGGPLTLVPERLSWPEVAAGRGPFRITSEGIPETPGRA